MAKISQQNQKITVNNIKTNDETITKVKRKRKSVPRDSPPQRSSIFRGVTRHRWTGRYEAHLWDKSCWNESQKKKGRQVYLGAYNDEEAAAHTYDLAALKYWGPETILNFPVSTYQGELEEMESQSREEYIGSLRRKSSGFSRGVSKYRGVARHHHNGRWEARIGRVFGNKYLYLGTYATQEEAATAYDMAAIEYRGLNAVTNFDLSRYIKWLRPNPTDSKSNNSSPDPHLAETPSQEIGISILNHQTSITSKMVVGQPRPTGGSSASSALGLLFQSSKFKEMLERTSAVDYPSTPPESDPPRFSFPEEIQTYFECQDSDSYVEGNDIIFCDLNTFSSPMFQHELDA
ncbi:Ap2-like ethylene-responsive transcription factor [Thalictrum thalictroides]|uniref:Ap2-like ethylene-responsive transcription factor n=1 Tax=Thalictrum thalictroides TaxID=46969 RepID=A0A7J6VML1_THATH|nr:Ap2-like ethylene-responsive transcription factor [Thalictrum thalictroides]